MLPFPLDGCCSIAHFSLSFRQVSETTVDRKCYFSCLKNNFHMILLRFEHSYWSLVTAYDKLESVGHFHVILILCKVHSCQAGTDIKLLSLSDVLHNSEVSCFQGCKRVIHQVSATKTEVIRSLSLKFLEGNEMFFSNVSRMTPYPSIHLWAASNLVERYQQIKRNSFIVTKLNEYLDFEEG